MRGGRARPQRLRAILFPTASTNSKPIPHPDTPPRNLAGRPTELRQIISSQIVAYTRIAMRTDPTPDLDQLAVIAAECASLNVRKASRTITRLYAAAFEEIGLEPTQFTLLVASCRTPRVTMSALAMRLSMERSALARNIAVLERRRLLKVEPGEDRRVRHISATAAGRRKLAEALPHWRAVQDILVESFGRETFISLIASLQAMTQTGQKLLQDAAQDTGSADVAV